MWPVSLNYCVRWFGIFLVQDFLVWIVFSGLVLIYLTSFYGKSLLY